MFPRESLPMESFRLDQTAVFNSIDEAGEIGTVDDISYERENESRLQLTSSNYAPVTAIPLEVDVVVAHLDRGDRMYSFDFQYAILGGGSEFVAYPEWTFTIKPLESVKILIDWVVHHVQVQGAVARVLASVALAVKEGLPSWHISTIFRCGKLKKRSGIVVGVRCESAMLYGQTVRPPLPPPEEEAESEDMGFEMLYFEDKSFQSS